jgi:hypothetical protein
MCLLRRSILPAVLGSFFAAAAGAMPIGWAPPIFLAEINPAWSAIGSCLLVAALIFRHSAKFRK